jgi:WD40 repeat protein
MLMKRKIAQMAILLFTFSTCLCQTPNMKKEFEWSRRNFIILDPEFSNSENEITFSNQFYIPDGHYAEGREEYLDSLYKIIKNEPRIADPVVSILNLKTKQLNKIDFGWTPSFSPNDQLVVYTYQKNPISGKRVLAATLKGNYIKLFSRRDTTKTTLISPETTFLMNPTFLDSTNVVYKIGDAVNGDFGGAIGLNNINIINRKTQVLFSPKKDYGYYNLVGKIFNQSNSPEFMIYTPQDKGYKWIANEYGYELRNINGVVCNFGNNQFTSFDSQVSVDNKGLITIIDNRSNLRSDPPYIVYFNNKKEINRMPLKEEISHAFLSPDGNFLVYINADSDLYLMNMKTQDKIKVNSDHSEFYGLVWAKSSKKFAIVSSDEKYIGTDKLTIYRIE